MSVLLLINILLIPRMIVYFNEKPLDRNKLLFLALSRLSIFIVFEFTILLAAFITIIILIDLYITGKEDKVGVGFSYRSISLFIILLQTGILASDIITLRTYPIMYKLLQLFSDFYKPIELLLSISPLKINMIILGFILVSTESNIIIKLIFDKIGLFNNIETAEVDKLNESEIRAGRIIGLLERYFVYLFVLLGKYEIIAFIIATKGLARYKEMDKRKFSEYFLIGTLSSLLISLLISGIISYYLKS